MWRFAVTGLLTLAVSCGSTATGNDPLEEIIIPRPGFETPLSALVYRPSTYDPSAPVVIVIHGASRNPETYCRSWFEAAEAAGSLIACPDFKRADFPSSWQFNLGNVIDRDTGQMRPREAWSFLLVESLFDEVRQRYGSERDAYRLFGHSAGSQFVHRLLMYVPDARVEKAVAANAGWYTFPDESVAFPYGLGNSGLAVSELKGFFARDLLILLGDEDTETASDNLRKTPEANRQGRHRFARGQAYFQFAKETARARGVDFGWSSGVVRGAGHSQSQMAPAAAQYLLDLPAIPDSE